MSNEELVEILLEIETLKPLVRQVMEGLKSYESEYQEILDFLVKSNVSIRTSLFEGFIERGFTREEAMTLTLNSVQQIKNSVETVSKGGK